MFLTWATLANHDCRIDGKPICAARARPGLATIDPDARSVLCGAMAKPGTLRSSTIIEERRHEHQARRYRQSEGGLLGHCVRPSVDPVHPGEILRDEFLTSATAREGKGLGSLLLKRPCHRPP